MKQYKVVYMYIEDELHEIETLIITDDYEEAIDVWAESVMDFRMSVYINAIDEGFDPARGYDSFVDTKWRTIEHRFGYMFAENEQENIICVIKIECIE